MDNDRVPMLDERSKTLRRLLVKMIEAGGRGHIGPAASLVELLRVLYDSWLQFRPEEPTWPGRDRFVLSKGHGCLALYAILADKGFFPVEELATFCSSTSRLGGHPEIKVPGVEASTGALGHGLPISVGLALAAKIRREKYRVAVVVGDGEIDEGSIWEAAMSAAKHQLSNLTVFIDYNKMQSYGSIREVMNLEPLADKWLSFGFEAGEVDGHDIYALKRLVSSLPLHSSKPSVVICHTTKGKGFPIAEERAEWHHKSGLSTADIAALYESLGLIRTIMRKTSLNCVYQLAKTDERVVFIGSDLGAGVLESMKQEMPDRWFMEGVAEQHIIGMAAGLAMEGFLPYVNTIATFLTRRCFEQLVVDLSLHRLPVRLIANGGGVVYAPLGPTHQGIEDIAILRAVPNMTVVAPCDARK